MTNPHINIFWFRRDLRVEDNHGLFKALQGGIPVLPLFIFDTAILSTLDRCDARVSFIYQQLDAIHRELRKSGTSLYVVHGEPEKVFADLVKRYSVEKVFANEDYEPYGRMRDEKIQVLLKSNSVSSEFVTDHLIFRPGMILKDDGKPYTVFTPFMKRWKLNFSKEMIHNHPSEMLIGNFYNTDIDFPSLERIGFNSSSIEPPQYDISAGLLGSYAETRNRPDIAGTSNLSTHLRFGTISVRSAVSAALDFSETFLNELIWREFFSHILYHFPEVEEKNFRRGFDLFPWENDPVLTERWMAGTTGFPIVDAGMRQLVSTGLMHNRVRMITASFLVKDLLTDWRIGEAFFARHLLDYELSSNNGNWQWAAGTGCDAAPFFRIFNPYEQQKRFDPDLAYVKRWVSEYGTSAYPDPVVDHALARKGALEVYKSLR